MRTAACVPRVSASSRCAVLPTDCACSPTALADVDAAKHQAAAPVCISHPTLGDTQIELREERLLVPEALFQPQLFQSLGTAASGLPELVTRSVVAAVRSQASAGRRAKSETAVRQQVGSLLQRVCVVRQLCIASGRDRLGYSR